MCKSKNIYNVLTFDEFCVLFGIEERDNGEIFKVLVKMEENGLNIIKELEHIETLRFISEYKGLNKELMKNKLLKIYLAFSQKA